MAKRTRHVNFNVRVIDGGEDFIKYVCNCNDFIKTVALEVHKEVSSSHMNDDCKVA